MNRSQHPNDNAPTRTLTSPDGTPWTVAVLPPSAHNPTDRRVWLSFASDDRRRTEAAPPGFDLELADDEQLMALLARDQWGLLSHPDMDGPTPAG